MPFCVSCGQENKVTAKFCTGCGWAMAQQSPIVEPAKAAPLQAQGSTKPANSLPNKVILGGIVLVLAVLVFWLLTKDNKATYNNPATTAPVAQSNPPSSPPDVQPEPKAAPINMQKKEAVPVQTQSDALIDAIKNIIGQYYALIGNNDCYSINAYYEPVLENYYNRRNLNRSEVLTDCVTYQKRWPINSTTVDYNSLQVTNLSNGSGYLVTYHLSSSIKKIESDDWKTYSLFITIHFTDQLKIKSIYEIKQ
jgi:hypothetical protein